jgi:hypothetical protein
MSIEIVWRPYSQIKTYLISHPAPRDKTFIFLNLDRATMSTWTICMLSIDSNNLPNAMGNCNEQPRFLITDADNN